MKLSFTSKYFNEVYQIRMLQILKQNSRIYMTIGFYTIHSSPIFSNLYIEIKILGLDAHITVKCRSGTKMYLDCFCVMVSKSLFPSYSIWRYNNGQKNAFSEMMTIDQWIIWSNKVPFYLRHHCIADCKCNISFFQGHFKKRK